MSRDVQLMITGKEIKSNLLGCLEIALFMPAASKRFGDTFNDAVKSVLIPILLVPLSLLAIYLIGDQITGGASEGTIALLYSLRMVGYWFLFFTAVSLIAREFNRGQYFFKFITAINWSTIPSTIIFAPIAYLLLSGAYTWNELQPLTMCIMFYSYAFSAFLAANILKIPWELAACVTYIGVFVNDETQTIFSWFAQNL